MKNMLIIDDNILKINRERDFDQSLEKEISKFSIKANDNKNDNLYYITEESIQKGLEDYEPEQIRMILTKFSQKEHLSTNLESLLDSENSIYDKPKIYYETHKGANHSTLYHTFLPISNEISLEDISELIPKKWLTSSYLANPKKTSIINYRLKEMKEIFKEENIIVKSKKGLYYHEVFDYYKKLNPPEDFETVLDFLRWAEKNIENKKYVKTIAFFNGYINSAD